MSEVKEKEGTNCSSRHLIVNDIFTLIALVIGIITLSLSIQQFHFWRGERTKPLQAKIFACFNNLSSYFNQIKRFPNFGYLPPLEANEEQYFSPSIIVLEFAKKLKKVEEEDMFLLNEDAHQSQEVKPANKFLQEINTQKKRKNSPKLFEETGRLKYVFLIDIFNPRETKIDITAISCSWNKWIEYLNKKTKDRYSIWPIPNMFFSPCIYCYNDNEWKKVYCPIEISSDTHEYIIVLFDSCGGNVLEMVFDPKNISIESEFKKGNKFMYMNQMLLNYLNSFRGIEIIVSYDEDKKLVIPPSSTVSQPQSHIFWEEQFPNYKLGGKQVWSEETD